MRLFFYNKPSKKELLFFLNYGLVVFLSGFFLSTFDILVHIKFFHFFNYKYLASAYILSGFFGIVVTHIYSGLYKRLSNKLFFFCFITFIVSVSIVFYLWHNISGNGEPYYYGMVLLFPLNTLLLLVLWRFGRKQLYPDITRKLFPFIKASFLLGITFGAGVFAIGLFLTRLHNLVMASFIAMLLIWPFHLLLLYSLGKGSLKQKITEKYIPGRNKPFLLFNSRFTASVFIFILLSSIVGYTLHYAFVNVAWVAFQTEIGMAKFYGLFYAAMGVFILGVDRYIIKKILYSYDSPYSLILVPLTLLLAMVIVIAVNFFVVSAQKLVDHFSVFFLFLSILKVAYTALSYTVQAPSFRTLFHSLDPRYRQVVYPRIEGTVLMSGLTLAGIIILALTYIKYYSLTIIILFAIVVSVVWVFVGIRLLKLYSQALRDQLSRMRLKETTIQENLRFEEHLSSFFADQDPDKIITAMNISKVFQPMVFERDLVRLLAHPSNEVHSYVLDNILSESVYEALPLLKERKEQVETGFTSKYETIITKFEQRKNIKVSESDIAQMLYDADDKVRERLLGGIENSENKEITSTLVSLLKDSNLQIRNKAIKAIAKKKESKFNYPLIEFLSSNNYNPYAFEAIASSKDKALEYLEREAMLPSTDNIVLKRIIRLFGKIGTPRAIQNLLSNIDNNDSFIMNQSIEVLFDIRFQASNEEKVKLLGYFVKHVSLLAFNLNIFNHLYKKKKYEILAHAYLLESEKNIEHLFKLLSLIYNPNIILSLRKFFKYGSRAEISHAVELMDEHINEDIKPLLLILVEDIPLVEKLRRLDYYFPQRKLNFHDILSLSLTYDFNSLSLYTRTCALVLIDFLGINDFMDEITFCSEHPNLLLRETAHFINTRIKQKQTNVKPKLINRFEQFIEDDNYKSLLFYKLYRLKTFNVFNQLAENVTIKLVQSVKLFELNKEERLTLDELHDISLLISDKIVVNENGSVSVDYKDNFIHVELIRRKGIKSLMLNEAGIIWGFDEATVQKLLLDNVELANLLLSSVEELNKVDNEEQRS